MQDAEMRIEFDRSACQGHNRCYLLAPALFDVDDEGYAVLLESGALIADQQVLAQLTVDNCPEFAITLVDD